MSAGKSNWCIIKNRVQSFNLCLTEVWIILLCLLIISNVRWMIFHRFSHINNLCRRVESVVRQVGHPLSQLWVLHIWWKSKWTCLWKLSNKLLKTYLITIQFVARNAIFYLSQQSWFIYINHYYRNLAIKTTQRSNNIGFIYSTPWL